MFSSICRIQRINILLAGNGFGKQWTSSFFHRYFESHGLWYHKDIRKDDGGIHTYLVHRLQGNFRSQFRRLHAGEKIIFFSQLDIIRKIPACLPHHPYRRALNIFLPQCPQ